MKINAELIKKLRADKNWSQEQLSEASGLNLRTIQRIESSGKASLESVNLLAAAFNIDPCELAEKEKMSVEAEELTPWDAITTCFAKFTDFSGTATRYEFGWFLVFTLIILSIATVLHEKAGQIVALLLMLPFLAAGARRLHETGRSGWWQLFYLAPFGFVVVLSLIFLPAVDDGRELEEKGVELA